MELDDKHARWRELFLRELCGDPTAGAALDADWQEHNSEYCDQCGEIFCPYGEWLHFHHDGCPSCTESPAEGDKDLYRSLLLQRNGGPNA